MLQFPGKTTLIFCIETALQLNYIDLFFHQVFNRLSQSVSSSKNNNNNNNYYYYYYYYYWSFQTTKYDCVSATVVGLQPHCESERHATLHSHIASAYVDQFSKYFHSLDSARNLQQNLCVMFPTTPYTCCYTTFAKLKMPLLPFSHYSCYKKTYIEIHLFLLVNVIHIIWHIVP